MQKEEKSRRIRDNWSRILAVAILILLVISFFWVGFSLVDWSRENFDLQKPRTFHSTFGFNYAGKLTISEGSINDVSIDLAITYPHGTLTVDDAVTISGIAVLNQSRLEKAHTIRISFQNAQAFPVTQDINNMTIYNTLILTATQNSSVLVGTTRLTWGIEGTYNPLFVINFFNGTSSLSTPLLISTDIAITVHPKADSAQISTNNVAMILAVVVYALTLVGTGSLILALWDRQKPPENSENSPENPKTPAQANDEKSESSKSVAGKSNNDHTK